jgi:4-hydroxy-3-polyprenylbenzoate decarboxylase
MAYYKDLREFLEALEKAGKLRRILRPINKDTELHPLVRWQFRGLEESERFGFLFEHVTGIHAKDYNGSVASAVIAPCLDVYALALKCHSSRQAMYEKWAEAFRRPIPPLPVESGPVKEEIHVGEGLLAHGGLNEFPIPMTTNGWEALPRLSGLCWFSKDPETGNVNVGTYNGVYLGPLESCARVSPRGHLRIHWQKCKARGIPLQVAAVVGASPPVVMTSITEIPYGISEMDVAGGLAGEPIPVVRCETVGLEVPATSEVVLEGEIPTDYTLPDPASGEHTGYTFIDRPALPFHIRCITHRRNPIWHDIVDQFPPSESSVMGNINREAHMLNFLRNACGIPQVKDVAFHHCGGSRRLCIIRLQDLGGTRTSNRTVWHALQASLAVSTEWPKITVAVDEDIDPWDLESVFWAVCFRYQPHRDTHIIRGRGATADQSGGPRTLPLDEQEYPTSRAGPQGSSSLLIDATRKWPYTPTSLPTQSYMERAKEIWDEIGLPSLKPREPWYGVSWGEWPESYRRHAGMAERGEFDKIAEEILQQKKRV